jgi:hypothetical protein
LPSNFKIEPPPKKIGLKELSKMAKTKEPAARTQFPVVVYIPKPYSQNYIPMEKTEKFGKKRFCQKIEILTVANCDRKTLTVGGFKKHSAS